MLNHGPSKSGPYSGVRDFLATFTLNFFLLLLNNEEVEKLRCKLSGYMYRQYTLNTNPSTDGKRSAVYTGNQSIELRIRIILSQIGSLL